MKSKCEGVVKHSSHGPVRRRPPHVEEVLLLPAAAVAPRAQEKIVVAAAGAPPPPLDQALPRRGGSIQGAPSPPTRDLAARGRWSPRSCSAVVRRRIEPSLGRMPSRFRRGNRASHRGRNGSSINPRSTVRLGPRGPRPPPPKIPSHHSGMGASLPSPSPGGMTLPR